MNTTQTATVARLARRTQEARTSYWAAVADGQPRKAELIGRGLRVVEQMLIDAAGSPKAAKAAEVAYINSHQPK